jgi:hypothetical protein
MTQIIWRWSDQERSQGTGRWQVWEGRENAYTVLVGQSEGRKSLGRPKYRRKNNSKTDCKTWMNRHKLLSTSGISRIWQRNFRVSCNTRNSSWGNISFSMKAKLHGVGCGILILVVSLLKIFAHVSTDYTPSFQRQTVQNNTWPDPENNGITTLRNVCNCTSAHMAQRLRRFFYLKLTN